MFSSFRTLVLAMVCSLAGMAGQAEEAGEATLIIDEKSYHFALDAMQSDWSGSADSGSVNIYLRGADDETRAVFLNLSIGFTFFGGQSDAVEIQMMTKSSDGEILRLFGDPATSVVDVQADAFAASGNELTVEGQLSTTLGTSENFGRDIDLSNPLSASGVFSVTLGPV